MANPKQKVEVSIERDEHDSALFLIFDANSNRRKHKSRVYTRRDNAIVGCRRYCAANNLKISRWLV